MSQTQGSAEVGQFVQVTIQGRIAARFERVEGGRTPAPYLEIEYDHDWPFPGLSIRLDAPGVRIVPLMPADDA